jgi:pimeloyl-ACP methyl ester carboxylesterase
VSSTRFLVALFVACLVASAAAPGGARPGLAHVRLPADLVGSLNGVDYRIRVPADWNGTLLVYTHGTRLAAMPGPASPEVAPQPYPLPATPFEEQLLAYGYALAGAEYGNSQKAGAQASHALTEFFNGAMGRPARVIAWGNSLGGVVAALLLEKYPGAYDGAVANCGPLGGQAKNIDASLAYGLAYDVTFGWPADAWGPLDDLRDDLVFATDVLPLVQWPQADRYGRWEFIRLVMKLPTQAFWGVDPQFGVNFFAMQMWRATEVRSRLEAQYGGPVAQNLDHVYSLTDGEKDYLATLGVVDADVLLADMNARTNIQARHSARQLMETWSAGGRLRRPLLTMHSAYDGLALTANESLFRALVDQSAAGDRLMQVFTAAPGHCSFSSAELLATLSAMEHWLDTGSRPDPSFFPAAAGFSPGYVPPVWPF